MVEKKILPYEQLQSDTIKLVRFPLIVGVVMLHVAFETIFVGGSQFINIADFPAYDYYKFFFDKVLAVRIPLYFFSFLVICFLIEQIILQNLIT